MYELIEMSKLKDEIKCVCYDFNLVYSGNSNSSYNKINSNSSSSGSLWLGKELQFYSISDLN